MAKLSNYSENLLLNWLMTTGAATRPTAWHVSLHTADPTDAGGSEVTTVAYPAYTRKSATFGTASSGSTNNSADLTWTYDGGSALTVTHVAIYDAATSGNLLWHGALTQSKTLNNGDQFKISAANLTCSLD